jgi:hypothetical protein
MVPRVGGMLIVCYVHDVPNELGDWYVMKEGSDGSEVLK